MPREVCELEPGRPAIAGAAVASRSELPDCADKAVDPVAAEQASERSLARQVMQMGKRLAQRERHLVPVEGPPEQHREQLHRALGAFAGRNDLRATAPVMCREIVYPPVQAKEGKIVRRQDERLRRNCAAQPVE